MSGREQNYSCVTFWRSFCFASVALLAGCTYGNGGPGAATVAVATTAVAPAHAPRCWSNDDCDVNHSGALCMPTAVTKEQSDAEDFLGRAMRLHKLIISLGDSSSSSPIKTILQQVREDLSTYSQIAQGRVPSGADAGGGTRSVAEGAPLTTAQMQRMQDAAWMQSGATQADMIIRQFLNSLSTSPITTDARNVYTDVTGDSAGLHLDKVISDLQMFLKDIEVIVAPINTLVGYREADGGVPGPDTGAGAVMRYLGPILKNINDAMSSVNAFLEPSAISPLKNDLTMLSQGHDLVGKDGNPGTCLESP